MAVYLSIGYRDGSRVAARLESREARHDLRQHPRHDRPHADRAHAASGAGRHDRCTSSASSSIPARRSRIAWRSRSSRTPRRAARSSPARRWSKRLPAIPASRWRWCARPRAIPFVAVMVETFSVERRKIMRMFGARVILTPAAERGTGMVTQGRASWRTKHGWFLARQFENPANPAYHRNTTGAGNPVRLRGQAPRRIRHRAGARAARSRAPGEMIRLARPEVRIVAAEPEGGGHARRASRSRRTRSRAGRRTSFPRCSTARCRTAS